MQVARELLRGGEELVFDHAEAVVVGGVHFGFRERGGGAC